MSKKFKDKQCVYCDHGTSTKSGDHIFPRQLFLEKRRSNLPKVACCKACNDTKSKLEHYLLTVLPFGARHPDAHENLTTKVPGRLGKNVSLHKELNTKKSMKYVQVDTGLILPSMTVPFEIGKLIQLFNYITRALASVHFGIRIQADDLVFSSIDFDNIDGFLNGKSKNKICNDLGNGTVLYSGVQATDNDKITAWEFILYGGLQFDEKRVSNIVSFTGPKKTIENVRLRKKFQI